MRLLFLPFFLPHLKRSLLELHDRRVVDARALGEDEDGQLGRVVNVVLQPAGTGKGEDEVVIKIRSNMEILHQNHRTLNKRKSEKRKRERASSSILYLVLSAPVQCRVVVRSLHLLATIILSLTSDLSNQMCAAALPSARCTMPNMPPWDWPT